MTKIEFQKACLEAGIQLNEEQMNQFEKYMQLLIEWNEKMNLTAITQEEEVWVRCRFSGNSCKDCVSTCSYDFGGAFTKALSFSK